MNTAIDYIAARRRARDEAEQYEAIRACARDLMERWPECNLLQIAHAARVTSAVAYRALATCAAFRKVAGRDLFWERAA